MRQPPNLGTASDSNPPCAFRQGLPCPSDFFFQSLINLLANNHARIQAGICFGFPSVCPNPYLPALELETLRKLIGWEGVGLCAPLPDLTAQGPQFQRALLASALALGCRASPPAPPAPRPSPVAAPTALPALPPPLFVQHQFFFFFLLFLSLFLFSFFFFPPFPPIGASRDAALSAGGLF